MANIRKLSPKMAEYAENEIYEIPERVEKDLQHLRDWIEKQPYIKARMDNQWLVTFLRGCKYSLERSKEKIDTFYTSKALMPEFFRNLDPVNGPIKDVIHSCTVMPILNQEGSTNPFIIYYRQHFDPSQINTQVLNDLLKYVFLITEIYLTEQDSFSVNGLDAILDFELISLGHIMFVTPSILKKILVVVEKVFPIRVKSVHFINCPPVMERMLKIIKAFASPKLTSRMHVHSKLEELYKYIPQRLLSSDLGGEGPTRDEMENIMEKKLTERRDWILENEKFGTDEKLRPGKPQTSESFLGIEGSFRQLSVD